MAQNDDQLLRQAMHAAVDALWLQQPAAAEEAVVAEATLSANRREVLKRMRRELEQLSLSRVS